MSNEMTQVDIDQLKAELAERQARVPALRDEVKRTKEYGDLSENDEYRCAKREYNRNKSRMRYHGAHHRERGRHPHGFSGG